MTPVAHILGRMLLILGSLMLFPLLLDASQQNGNADAFLKSAFITSGFGGLVALATRGSLMRGFDVRSGFLLTLGIWVFIPMFGALPLMIGAPHLTFTDAYFEAVSGITTTGSTVIVGIADLPYGTNLWRGMLNWLGGLGIAFIAMIFLPVMRVGGMQFFRTEGFDTFGKILPRASDIALSLMGVYVGLTVVCMLTYRALGMTTLDSVVHAFATIATGGFSPKDISFNAYPGAGEYAGAFFMAVAAFPYIRYVQMVRGRSDALWRDPQVLSYLSWLMGASLLVTFWRVWTAGAAVEPVFRETLFNMTSIMTGTGFSSGTFTAWGSFGLVVAFVMGLIGGCSGSSSGALSVFRVQVSMAAIRAQMRLIAMPSRIEPVRYGGRAVEPETLNGVMMFVTGYIVAIGVLSVGMTLAGIDMETAVFAIWSSMGNIGYAVGDGVAPSGTYIEFPLLAKWIMIITMLLGRLALLTVFVMIMPRFWRA